ncbi:LysR family transcriptional regulator [Aliagarivorans taiwanensis]|uniref:LysR family transcriptional regulator n=1 Tax=Aliagarivorans taiwanensis TaxID=561966 RepID=UPI0003FB44F2|nr:LysR family transcriptional regulator [Aliagarivorans taiwanensis]
MRADDLLLFSQVIELGSFSKVAEENSLTNSVVSKRISRLEQAAGATLLYRTTRKLALTEAGRTLLQSANNVKLATQEAQQAVAGMGESLTGHIKMSVPTISGELLLADAVTEFCNRYPGLSVDMSLNNRFVDLVEEGFDLVIRTGHLEDSSLIARHILDSRWVVCASPAYLRQHGHPQRPHALSEHNCLQYAYHTSGARDWEFVGSEGNYVVRINGNYCSDNATALRKAVLGGHGIAYLPRCLIYQDLCSGALLELFPEGVAKVLGVYAIYPYTRYLPEKLKLLVEHIRQRYLAMAHYF